MRKKNNKKNKKKQRVYVNNHHKDRLFIRLFGSPENKAGMLSLYNALNDTEYSDVNALELYTIEDVIFLGMKNDVGYILDGYLSLWEHQSTKNPNMPLRGFLYHAKMYEKYIKDRDIDIFSSALQRIPTPQYYVFYNGDSNAGDIETLKLSASFINPVEEGKFEWTATMLNINLGHNDVLMEKCSTLKQYATLLDKIKDGIKRGMDVENSIIEAVNWCIANDVLKDYLIRHKSEVIGMVLTEYDEKKHIKNEKQISWEEGREEGREENRLEVATEMLKERYSLDSILRISKLPKDKIMSIAESLNIQVM